MQSTQAPPRVRLEILTIPDPCPADWSAMAVVDGDRTRFCRHCRKHVYNLSALTRPAAERFMAERFARPDAAADTVCVRMYRRADGTVVTADCDGAWRRAAHRARAGWLTVAALPALLAAAVRGDRTDVVVVRPPPVQPVVAVAGGCPAPPMLGRIRPPATRPVDPPPTTAPAVYP